MNLGLSLSLGAKAAHPFVIPAADGTQAGTYANFVYDQYAISGVNKASTDILTRTGGAKWVLGPAGSFVEVAANALAFDYRTGRRRLLIEGAATNIEFDQNNVTAWMANGASKTSGFTDIFGGTNAGKITANGAVSTHNVFASSNTFTSGVTYTMGVVVDVVDTTMIQMSGGSGAFGTGQYCNFSLVGSGSITASAGGSGTITFISTGRYLLTWTATATSTALVASNVLFFINSPTATRGPSFACSDSFIASGWQVVTGVALGSIIKTAGSPVTRATDVVQFSAAAAAALQGAAGCMVWRGKASSGSIASQAFITGASGGNLISAAAAGPTLIEFSGVAGANISSATAVLPDVFGMAYGFDGSGRSGDTSKTELVTDAQALTVARSSVYLGGSAGMTASAVQYVDEVLFFPIRPLDATVTSLARVWA